MMTFKRVISLVLSLALLISLTTACGLQDVGDLPDETQAPQTRTIIDVAGDEVEIPAKVETVVNLVPFGCHIMIGLGLGDYLIGVHEETEETGWIHTMYPRIAEIPGFSNAPDAEALLALDADVVMCDDREKAAEYRSKGINAITIMYYTIDEFKTDIKLIGEILGSDAQAKCSDYLTYLDSVIADVDAKLKDVVTTRETLYYINGNPDRGFYKTAGAGSTNDVMAQLAYADFATNYLITAPETVVDAEAILAINPENVIIGGRYQHVLYEELMAAPEWSNIRAVSEGNVFKIPMSMSAWNRYSIEIALMVPWTASVLYPEYYEFDALQETISFYERFSNYKLTEEQARNMLEGLTPDGEKEIASR